ncbi:serine/threonine-protein kinase MAK isoform X4 [Tachysurus ichikawai]
MFQVLSGLAFVHKQGFFHRDIKPENLLCMGPELVKIADFGLAREIRSRPPYTDYVSTRWYRAPEVLLRSSVYSSPIDMWAVGCIMAELYTLRPLFPGNSEVDEIFKICQVLGTVKKTDWLEGHQLAASMNFRFPQCVPTPLKTLIPNASNEALTLMKDLLHWDPKKRPTAVQALRYPYFQVGQVLGQRAQTPDLCKSQVKTPPSEIKSELQSASEPVLHSQTKDQGRNSHQPLQPISLPQAPVQASHQADPLALNTQKRNMGNENSVMGLKSGRRRWGQIKISDSWDELYPSDTAAFNSSKPSMGVEESVNFQLDCKMMSKDHKPMYTFTNVTKLPGSIKSNSSLQSTCSARQHYLRQSRYLPGLISKSSSTSMEKETQMDLLDNWSRHPKKRLAPMCQKDAEDSSINVSHKLRERIQEKLEQPKDNFISTTYNLSGGYITSFQKKEVGTVGQRVQLTPVGNQQALGLFTTADINTGKTKYMKPKPANMSTEDLDGWKKRSQLKETSYSVLGKNSGNILPRAAPVQPVHGRVDWVAKYGSHR